MKPGNLEGRIEKMTKIEERKKGHTEMNRRFLICSTNVQVDRDKGGARFGAHV